MRAIECAAFNGAVWAGENFYTLNLEPGHQPAENGSQTAVCATYVEQATPGREPCCEPLCQYYNATLVHEPPVKAPE